MGSRTGFDRLQDNGGPYQQRLRAHSTARENRRASRRRDGVSADNPRCRSLSSITSTASAARSTMELLGAEVNRAPGSDPNGLPGVKAHGQFTKAETATCARRQSHSGPPVPSRPQRQPCRFAGGQQTRRDDNIGAVRPRPHSVVEQTTVFHRVPSRAAVSRSNSVRPDRRVGIAKPDCKDGDHLSTTRHRRGRPADIGPGRLWCPRRK